MASNIVLGTIPPPLDLTATQHPWNCCSTPPATQSVVDGVDGAHYVALGVDGGTTPQALIASAAAYLSWPARLHRLES